MVALESTLIAHGLPRPTNLEVARGSERAVCGEEATPATIAVVGGRPTIGLSGEQIEWLANAAGVEKASRRDLAKVTARGLDAATTVSATLYLARKAGIRVMATGGLGGVHRGAAETFDISADLDELARADGAVVVCSGVKVILDVAATLESLETRGVVVVGYRTDWFPAFTCGVSDLRLDTRADSAAEVAEIVKAHRTLGLPGAIVVAQAVDESVALDRAEMERALMEALQEANARGVRGKAITPFLLARLSEATEGRSLRANSALIVENARLAGEIAVALAQV